MRHRRKLMAMQGFVYATYTYLLFTFFNKHARFGTKVNKIAVSENGTKDSKITDIAWAIKLVEKNIPWKNVCRHQAYQAKLLCNYYQIPYFIFIGFKKDIEKNEIQAHAWTIAGGKMITGLCNPEEYIVQSIYSN